MIKIVTSLLSWIVGYLIFIFFSFGNVLLMVIGSVAFMIIYFVMNHVTKPHEDSPAEIEQKLLNAIVEDVIEEEKEYAVATLLEYNYSMPEVIQWCVITYKMPKIDAERLVDLVKQKKKKLGYKLPEITYSQLPHFIRKRIKTVGK